MKIISISSQMFPIHHCLQRRRAKVEKCSMLERFLNHNSLERYHKKKNDPIVGA